MRLLLVTWNAHIYVYKCTYTRTLHIMHFPNLIYVLFCHYPWILLFVFGISWCIIHAPHILSMEVILVSWFGLLVKDVLLTVVGALRTLLLPMRPNSYQWGLIHGIRYFFIIILFGYISLNMFKTIQKEMGTNTLTIEWGLIHGIWCCFFIKILFWLYLIIYV